MNHIIPPPSQRGFTLVELTVVLVIVGLLITAGIASWSTLIDARKVALTQATLNRMRFCLTTRGILSEQFPSKTFNLALDCSNMNKAKDVDACLCSGQTDAWNRPVYFLSGTDGQGKDLEGTFFASDSVRGQIRTRPGGNSSATDSKGKQHKKIAYILVSFGRDGVADNESYGASLNASRVAVLPAKIDFQTGHVDDQYEIITSRELQAALKK